jgi:3-hydroxyisobutyrate dehydrogenase-like beta-hydroxyacid dehydrogenase
MAHIAFLGTGLLGAAFAEAAAQRGDAVSVWNRTPRKAQALAAFGALVATSPAEAVRGAARVHLVLKDDAVVEEVIAAARPGLGDDVILIDHSTTQPAATAKRAARYAAEGLSYLHCPVFMTPMAARNAKGSMLAAGPQGLFESVREELAHMTGRLEYCGERPDLAATLKLAGNAVILSLAGAMADVLAIARGAGVDGEATIRLLTLLDLNAMVTGRGMAMARGDFAPSFELAMARKDLRLMQETAGELPLAVLPGLAARMEQLVAAGHGNEDITTLAIAAVAAHKQA